MPMLNLVLGDKERDALSVLAEREYRDPRAQAALIIRRELERVGLLPANAESEGTHYEQPISGSV